MANSNVYNEYNFESLLNEAANGDKNAVDRFLDAVKKFAADRAKSKIKRLGIKFNNGKDDDEEKCMVDEVSALFIEEINKGIKQYNGKKYDSIYHFFNSICYNAWQNICYPQYIESRYQIKYSRYKQCKELDAIMYELGLVYVEKLSAEEIGLLQKKMGVKKASTIHNLLKDLIHLRDMVSFESLYCFEDKKLRNPQDIAVVNERNEILQRAMDKVLTPKEQFYVKAVYYDKMKQNDVAKMVGCTPQNANDTINRAIRKLRKELYDYYYSA